MPKQFEFCRVCRRNHNQGRGHRYSVQHKHCLDRVLDKFLERIEEARRLVKSAQAVTENDPDGKKFWCPFCEQEVSEQEQPQLSLFKCAQAITHLGSQAHTENVRKFCAEHGCDAGKFPMYVIEGADLAMWEKASKTVPPSATNGSEEKFMQSDDCVSELPKHTPQPSLTGRVTTSLCLGTSPIGGLSIIRVPPHGSSGGNVHSGAAPLWFKHGSAIANETPKGFGCPSSSLSPRAKSHEKKLAKIRNPNRVGAAWAERRRVELQKGETMPASDYDNSLWLPSFGRVWQGGPRRDTRKEFETEKRLEAQKHGQRGQGLTSSTQKRGRPSVELKPYVSRQQRMALEAARKSGSADAHK